MTSEINPREMMLLREMLDKAGVEYRTEDYESPVPRAARRMEYHTMSTDWEIMDNFVIGFSVILTPFSYGGSDGLLELWCEGDEPVGWLGADNVMERLREAGIVDETTRRD